MSIPADLTDFQLAPKKYGSAAGKRVDVFTNCYKINSFPDKTIFQYDVSIIPVKNGSSAPPTEKELTAKLPEAKTRPVFREFVKLYGKAKLGSEFIPFDGQKVCYSPVKLKLTQKSTDFNLDVVVEGVKRSFIVRIALAAEIQMGYLNEYIDGKSDTTSNNWQPPIRVLDTLISNYLIESTIRVGRSYFTQKGLFPLGDFLTLHKGVFCSVRPGEKSLFLNIDIAFGPFYNNFNCIDFLVSSCKLGSVPNLIKAFGASPRLLSSAVRGVMFTASHWQGKQKFKAAGVTHKPMSELTFECEMVEGQGLKKISVQEYFRKKYSVNLKYLDLPCLTYGANLYMPMELCSIAENQYYNKKLAPEFTEIMVERCRMKPNERFSEIRAAFDSLFLRENRAFTAFNMKFSNNFTNINSKMLISPQVAFKNKTMQTERGAFDLRGVNYFQGSVINNWGVFALLNKSEIDMKSLGFFVDNLVQFAGTTGITFKNKRPLIEYGNPMNASNEFQKFVNKLYSSTKVLPDIVFVVIGQKSTPLYEAIKNPAYKRFGIQTQVMLKKHLLKGKNLSYISNICLKINTKSGGITNTVKSPIFSKMFQLPTIVFGADVSHPGIGDYSSPSVSAIVASSNMSATRYSSRAYKQSSRLEIIQNLEECVKQQITEFRAKTNSIPQRIIFYRDGVSEGQYMEVVKTEISAIRRACKSLSDKYSPKLLYIVATKRHHMKFAMNINNRTDNCNPGLVVDNTIVSPVLTEFYLQSHNCGIGTSRNTKYTVLVNEIGIDIDSVEAITYDLCYQYAICNKSVSIVTPVYYAHRLSLRAKIALGDPNDDASSVSSGAYDQSKNIEAEPLKISAKLQNTMYYM
ncbi:hypothetical protein BB559_006092 [Furculomyces boomerangus]|uniref:Piwi domain-containing protein n=1 Tax=Furculomyces boomerangus TaxID=61424 RepID=A0A2T9Y4T1_9FUNG|nr:hypothetical protein BB559_006092 [Furculomyces boomerangus]